MTQVFDVSGLHCGGCVTRVSNAVGKLAPGASVTLEPPRLTLPEGMTLDAATINAALASLGSYRVKDASAQG